MGRQSYRKPHVSDLAPTKACIATTWALSPIKTVYPSDHLTRENSVQFIHLLNECPIVFIRDVEVYGYAVSEYGDKSGFEVYSIYGEIKCFANWESANRFRIAEIHDFISHN